MRNPHLLSLNRRLTLAQQARRSDRITRRRNRVIWVEVENPSILQRLKSFILGGQS